MHLRVGSHLLSFFIHIGSVKHGYGIKSVDNEKGHLLLVDIDSGHNGEQRQRILSYLSERFPHIIHTLRETQNGYHVILWRRFTFRDFIQEYARFPYSDLSHLAIGIKRGYWYLETKRYTINPILAATFDADFMGVERA